MDTFRRDCDAYLLNKFRKPFFDPATGVDNATLKAEVRRMAEVMLSLPRPIAKAKIFQYIAENVYIDVNSHDFFPGFGCYDRNDRPMAPAIGLWQSEVDRKLKLWPQAIVYNQCGAAAIWKDFDHSVPDWDALLSLGFPGILSRIRAFRHEHEKNGTLTPEVEAYFDGLVITWEAIIKLTLRLRNYASAHADGNPRMLAEAECLDALANREPRTYYEVLQLIYLYFIYSEHIDHMQVRSLGNLDVMLQPFYDRDLKEKRFSNVEMRLLTDHFLMQWQSINNYWGQPFYLGGTNADGSSLICPMSYLILDEAEKLQINTPKIQIKIASNTPDAFLNKALAMIREYNASIVLVSEENYCRAGMGLGYSEEEMRTCDIRGCYEFNIRGKGNGTGVGYLNLLKGVELALNNGVDPLTGNRIGLETGDASAFATFGDFYQACLKQMRFLSERVMDIVDEFEAYLQEINPAQVFSATIEHSLQTAKDAFANGMVYNNTGLLHTGIGSTVDALLAVKHFVYEQKKVSLPELREILRQNWRGHEELRQEIWNDPAKYGNGSPEADRYADALSRVIAAGVNLRPNARGNFWYASLHCAKQYFNEGKSTGATPDGRFAGTEMSKNASPAMGMDRNGVTALIRSVTSIDSALFPGDFPLDVMLHPVTIQGEEGLAAMKTLVKTYFKRGGMAIHFNIFDVQTLREAQAEPEKYQSLQVRVCGWNIHFNDMAKVEQDEYIRRAENIIE